MNNNDKHPEGCRCMLCQGLPGQGLPGQGGKCEACGQMRCPYHGFGPGCGYGCGFGYRRHGLIRVLIAIAIALAIFWFGTRIGAFMFGGYGYGSGYRMMRDGYYPMMGYWQNGAAANATSTAQ